MKLPTVAIIGRPNTGKSTLFNRLLGSRKAIVSNVPGTTRDRIAGRVETEEMDYLLVDTAGMGGGSEDRDLEDDVALQSQIALESADVILFTINAKEDLTSADTEVANALRTKAKRHVPVIVVITKCDNPQIGEEFLPTVYELGIDGEIIQTSASHAIGLDDLETSIVSNLKDLNFGKPPEPSTQNPVPRIAIVGKPNVGKSSLVNAFLADDERGLLVSDIAGTTRDSTDTIVKYHDKQYVFVDTAGIKRRGSTSKGIETFAALSSIRSIESADVAVLVLDSTQEISKQDKRIAGLATDAGTGLIILLNKIDLLEGGQKAAKLEDVRRELAFCSFASILPVSAKNRAGLLKIFDLVEMVADNRARRIADKDLHRWYSDSLAGQPMHAVSGKHITQAADVPPTFVLFVKDPKKVQVSQLRYLENSMRKTFGFEGTPIRWITKFS